MLCVTAGYSDRILKQVLLHTEKCLLTQPARNLTQSPLRVRAQPLVHTSCIGGGRFETAAAKNALAPKKRATRPREGGERGRGERI